MKWNNSAERQGRRNCPQDNRSGGSAPVEIRQRHSGEQQRAPQGDMTRRAPAIPHTGGHKLRRPLAILISLLLLLAVPLACDGGGSDSSNGNDGNGNGNGNGNSSDDTLPGAPTSLTATANGSIAIDLSWTAPASDGGSAITGYRIDFRKEGAADYSSAEVDTGDTQTDYSHTGLTAATQYSYQVSAINANGSGPASEVAMATTASLAADPKPGAPTNLAATPGNGEVTLSWTDPMHCGNGNLCSETDHEHYLEYKLTSASDWSRDGDGVVASGNAHATMHIVMMLTGGMSYDFRLAVQLTDETDRGPWADISAQPQMDRDGDGVADTSDAFPDDACASVDSDGDGLPDTILAAGSTAPGGSVACSAASTLVADAFPDDACASVDGDGNGKPDAIIAPGDSDADACTVASTLTPDEDGDGDGMIDNLDVDDDNDGLIEIATRAELENMAYDLAGSSYRAAADTVGDTAGAPATEPANCSDVDADGDDDPSNDTVLLCGYELTANIDLEGSTTGSGGSISCASNAWEPIGGCGSDGNCGETSGNDDHPFTAIFEGNGHTISNLCIEGDGDTSDHDVLGLFGHLRGATVQNFAIAEVYIESSFTNGDSDINGDNNRIGALAGYVSGAALIRNVAATDSDSDIDLQGAATSDLQSIGGLVGEQSGGGIIASSAAVAVNGGAGALDEVGGLVGFQSSSSIAASFATGSVDGGAGDSDVVGGLVGGQSSSSIAASFATGAVDGGADDTDFVGGLVGEQSSSSIGASFATGNVSGGGGSSDNVGGLVGSPGAITASYSFGTVAMGTIVAGSAGSDKPSGVMMVAQLAGDSGDATTYAGAAWSSSVWDFGDSTQAPALRYIGGYTRGDGPDNTAYTSDDTHSYSCAAADFPASLSVTCNTTLLPGPAGSPQVRQ